MEVYTVKVNKSGTRFWYQNDVLHRTDGPAVELPNGGKRWYVGGKRHRTDGPAVEWDRGTKEWWVEGKKLTEEEFNKLTQTHKDMPLTEREAAIWNSAVACGRFVKPVFVVTHNGYSTTQEIQYTFDESADQ